MNFIIHVVRLKKSEESEMFVSWTKNPDLECKPELLRFPSLNRE